MIAMPQNVDVQEVIDRLMNAGNIDDALAKESDEALENLARSNQGYRVSHYVSRELGKRAEEKAARGENVEQHSTERETPAPGTLAREQLEAEHKTAREREDTADSQADELDAKYEKMRDGTKAKAAMKIKRDAAKQTVIALREELKPLYDRMGKAHDEDLLSHADAGIRIAGAGKLGREKHAYQKIVGMARCELAKQGITGEDAYSAATDAASMLTSYPHMSNGSLADRVKASVERINRERTVHNATMEVQALEHLQPYEKADFTRQIEREKWNPIDVAKRLDEAKAANESAGKVKAQVAAIHAAHVTNIASTIHDAISKSAKGLTERDVFRAVGTPNCELVQEAFKRLMSEGKAKIVCQGASKRVVLA